MQELTTKAGSGSILKVAAVRMGSKKCGVAVVTQCDTWRTYSIARNKSIIKLLQSLDKTTSIQDAVSHIHFRWAVIYTYFQACGS